MIKKIIFITLFLLVTTPASSIANETFPPLQENEIDKLVNKALTSFNVPGIAVAIIKDGKIVHAKVMGYVK
jgi:CubicO group peptidase (beta-lactamase class C family)